jgi:1-deoxy-D-xylulose 5-phosphate reductoisomerase
VAAFLDGLISWLAIAEVIEATLDGHDGGGLDTAEDVVEADRRARERARRAIERRTGPA